MVVNGIRDFGHLVCACEDDVLPLFFGGYYHDSIEDARLTYNDVMKTARHFLKEEQAFLATEIARGAHVLKGQGKSTIRAFARLPMHPLSSCVTV